MAGIGQMIFGFNQPVFSFFFSKCVYGFIFNNRKSPRFKFGSCGKQILPFEYFQVRGLQNFMSHLPILAATVQSPSVTIIMVLFKLGSDTAKVHGSFSLVY